MAVTRVYRCQEPGCYHLTDYLHRDYVRIEGAWTKMEEPEKIPCERCGHLAPKWVTAPVGRVPKTDYVDTATGQFFKNEAEEAEYDRAHGLRRPDDADIRAVANYRLAAEKDEAEFQDYATRLEEDPAMSGFRDLREKGYYTDHAKAAAAGADRPVSTPSIITATATEITP